MPIINHDREENRFFKAAARPGIRKPSSGDTSIGRTTGVGA